MNGAERRYVLDANLFARGFREPPANAEIQRFHYGIAPFEYLSAVVVQDLVAGARSGADRRAFARHVVDLFRRRGRTVTPSNRAWHESGSVLAEPDGQIIRW